VGPYQFIQTKSQLSTVYVEGVKKISLSCENHAEFDYFLWVNAEEKVVHLQFIFHENVLEWFEDRGILISQTNRKDQLIATVGVHKGVRTLQGVQDSSILEEGRSLIRASVFPEPYGHWIQEKFLSD
jgi:hypothetical protein